MSLYDPALRTLRSWFDSWVGIGHVAVGMHRRGFDLQLTQYDERGWRATFYTTGMEHSPTSATGPGWEPTPWHATLRACLRTLEGFPKRFSDRDSREPDFRKLLFSGNYSFPKGPSTQPGWSTCRRARRVWDGTARRGTRHSERRGRRRTAQAANSSVLLEVRYALDRAGGPAGDLNCLDTSRDVAIRSSRLLTDRC